jgi:hypothetical protein
VHLRLEPGAATVAERFDETFHDFQTVGMLQQLRADDKGAAISWKQIEEAEDKVRVGTRELEATMKTALAELEQPFSR